MSRSNLLLAGVVISLLSSPSFASETREKHADFIASINEALLDNFVFPQIAPRYVDNMNQCLEQDCLSGLNDADTIAKTLTERLQSVYPDKHLAVFAPGYLERRQKERAAKRKSKGKALADSNGIVEVKILDNNIGYFKIDGFPGTDESIKATHEAMKKLKDTKAVIFDIRDHRGGSPENITEIGRFLFQAPTHMVTTRSPHVNQGQPTPHQVEPNEFAHFYQDKPVYLLVSARSGSAAEHFAMSMKSTGRAILIGQTTGGYGHWGGVVQFDNGYSMFVPSGRTYHPKNGLGWEGIGITPDIMVDEQESLNYTIKRIVDLN